LDKEASELKDALLISSPAKAMSNCRDALQ
jgi:hypothetical protein